MLSSYASSFPPQLTALLITFFPCRILIPRSPVTALDEMLGKHHLHSQQGYNPYLGPLSHYAFLIAAVISGHNSETIKPGIYFTDDYLMGLDAMCYLCPSF